MKQRVTYRTGKNRASNNNDTHTHTHTKRSETVVVVMSEVVMAEGRWRGRGERESHGNVNKKENEWSTERQRRRAHENAVVTKVGESPKIEKAAAVFCLCVWIHVGSLATYVEQPGTPHGVCVQFM